jgi:hypothetical protein
MQFVLYFLDNQSCPVAGTAGGFNVVAKNYAFRTLFDESFCGKPSAIGMPFPVCQ